jgi:hypothetical protein
MAIICGNEKCLHPIPDIGDDHEGVLSPDALGCDWRHGFDVMECPECGALNVSWRVWPDGEAKHVTYLPTDGECHWLMRTDAEEFYHDPSVFVGDEDKHTHGRGLLAVACACALGLWAVLCLAIMRR